MKSFFIRGPPKPDPYEKFNTLYKKITDYVTGTAGSTEPTQAEIAQLYNYGYDAINNSPKENLFDNRTFIVSKLQGLKIPIPITEKIDTTPEPSNKTQLEQIQNWFTFFDDLNFTFFRHSNSCNNTKVGEGWGGLVNKDMEPSLTLVGLIDTIDFQKDIKKPKSYDRGSKQVLQVYTSALLRPILTAIILYGTPTIADAEEKRKQDEAIADAEEKRKQDEAIADTIASTSPTGLTIADADALAAADADADADAPPPPPPARTARTARTPNNRVLELNVSPFLNEKQGTIFKRGNYPESPDQMRKNVGSFLDTLSKLNEVRSLETIPGFNRTVSNVGLNFFFMSYQILL